MRCKPTIVCSNERAHVPTHTYTQYVWQNTPNGYGNFNNDLVMTNRQNEIYDLCKLLGPQTLTYFHSQWSVVLGSNVSIASSVT